MLYRAAFTAFVGLAMLSTPALAQKSKAPNDNVGDPNERICENITLTGSRLAVKRFCGTRAEWAERRRQDRDVTEQVQKGRHCQSQGGAQC
jgi:hypothetical protein